MKKVVLIIMALWLLLAGGVWATEKDCGQEDIKVEVGGRYLVESEIFYSNLAFTTGPQKPYVTSLTIKEISNSGKYALVLKLNEEKPSWFKVKDLKIIERLPEGGFTRQPAFQDGK